MRGPARAPSSGRNVHHTSNPGLPVSKTHVCPTALQHQWLYYGPREESAELATSHILTFFMSLSVTVL